MIVIMILPRMVVSQLHLNLILPFMLRFATAGLLGTADVAHGNAATGLHVRGGSGGVHGVHGRRGHVIISVRTGHDIWSLLTGVA